MEKIINYLISKYDPEAIIVYGSYADGSNNLGSDFDALVIAPKPVVRHDVSVVEGIRLDVFLYPPDAFDGEFDLGDFSQLTDGVIVLDRNGLAERLMERVREYLDNLPKKGAEEIEDNLAWCEKMLRRTRRADTEGYYRWHWVLVDSLQFYADILGSCYRGPKKTLRNMEQTDPEAFEVYGKALAAMEYENLQQWVNLLKRKWKENHHG